MRTDGPSASCHGNGQSIAALATVERLFPLCSFLPLFIANCLLRIVRRSITIQEVSSGLGVPHYDVALVCDQNSIGIAQLVEEAGSDQKL